MTRKENERASRYGPPIIRRYPLQELPKLAFNFGYTLVIALYIDYVAQRISNTRVRKSDADEKVKYQLLTYTKLRYEPGQSSSMKYICYYKRVSRTVKVLSLAVNAVLKPA